MNWFLRGVAASRQARSCLLDYGTVDVHILSQFFIGAAVLPIFESSALESVHAGSPGANVVVCARC